MRSSRCPKILLCTLKYSDIIFDCTKYLVWFTKYKHFHEIHDKLSFLTHNPSLAQDPSYITWSIYDHAIISRMFKIITPSIHDLYAQQTSEKSIRDDWVQMYGNKTDDSYLMCWVLRSINFLNFDQNIECNRIH